MPARVVANWRDDVNVNRLPGATGDAAINVAGVTVTHSSGSHSVQSITSSNAFILSGGTLTVRGNLGGSGTLKMSGGTLSNATVSVDTTVTGSTLVGTLNAVTLAGNLNLTATSARVAVSNRLTLNGTVTNRQLECVDFQRHANVGG